MTTFTMSTVTSDDLDALVASVAGLFSEDAGQHDTSVNLNWPAREGAAYYSKLINDPACLVLLARDDDRVVGHLVGKLTGPSSIQTTRTAVLESLRVTPDSRQVGVGSLLVTHFLDWARGSGAQRASVTAFAANDTAQRFYARHGFVPASVISQVAL
jgi:GNAT superfamily N-acetyltransferase